MKYHIPVIKLGQPNDDYKFKPLPAPSGMYPYHLNLADVISLPLPNQMSFHMVGDTGGSGRPEARQEIVNQISAQAAIDGFLYHLGDIVYHFGEAEQYEEQFFKPFELYPGPIFAIAGNHDGDVNPDAKVPYQSLDAFTCVFCDKVSISGISKRKSMAQPNIYWTLETPLATFISLYTNVPKYGIITPEQHSWFKEELLSAPKDKMLILCLHHAPYSADINHGSSQAMIGELETAFEDTGVRPDIVFSGHVHNYQRFEKSYDDGKVLPFIVAGSGGFDELHPIANVDDTRFAPIIADNVNLMAFNDTAHGFLKINIERNTKQILLNGEYYISGSPTPYDMFSVAKPLTENVYI